MNETDTLRGLIAKARRERDKSVRQLALAAQEAGHKIVGTTLNAIEAGTYHSVPTAETIRAIGWLARVSDDVAFTAAGRPVPGPPFAEELPPGVDDLTSPERRAAIAILRVLISQRQEINRYVDQAASSPAASAGASGEAREDEEAGLPDDTQLTTAWSSTAARLIAGGATSPAGEDVAVDRDEDGQDGEQVPS